MSLLDFLSEIDDEVQTIVDSGFEIEVTETTTVPDFDDSYITYPNLDDDRQRCKRLESCVLYVDIRDSTRISAATQPERLARMYSAFVRSMLAAARYYHGHVRNIIGDRVMVVFDRENCFSNAVDTAVLMNSLAKYVVNKHLRGISFRCGIGIDFGEMLITKAGAIRQGAEKEFYRSLVWLGTPANVASKLTDQANKTASWSQPCVSEGVFYPLTQQWVWSERSQSDFLADLEPTLISPMLRHKNPCFRGLVNTERDFTQSWPPILFTKAVYEGLRAEKPDDSAIKNKWWSRQPSSVPGYTGAVYGGNVIKTISENLR